MEISKILFNYHKKMYISQKYHFSLIFFILINSFLYPSITCLFRSLKKISDNGDYFVVLDSGLYIYNFEHSKRANITTFNETIFEEEDEYNHIIITKNENPITNEIKITALINQHLYIYNYGNSNIQYILVKFSEGNNCTYAFDVQLEDYNLIIYYIHHLIKQIGDEYHNRALLFRNYSSIESNVPKIYYQRQIYGTTRIMICGTDINNRTNINCISEISHGHMNFITLEKRDNGIAEINKFEFVSYNGLFAPSNWFINITFTSNKNIFFLCGIKSSVIKCYFKYYNESKFNEISYNSFDNNCINLTTYYFEEKNFFVLSGKKSNNEHCIYIFDGDDLNNTIQNKELNIDNYDGKSALIYNPQKNDLEIIYDDIFKEKFNENNYIIGSTEIANDKSSEFIYKTNPFVSYYEIKNKSSELNSDIYSGIAFNIFCKNIEEIAKNKIENELFITCDDYMIKFITTYFLKKYYYNYTSIINFGKCEEELKNYYNISNTSNLYILMIDFNLKGINHPIVEYEIFYPNENSTMEKLNLSICKDIKIELFIPINTTDDIDDIDKYNPKSSYYNDICTKATSESGTDIIIEDRRNEFIDKNMSLCEENCTFLEYDKDYKKAKCSCEVKTFFSFINEIKINKDKLMKNFKDINAITNIQIIKCYKIAFNNKNIIKNYGFYILSFIFLFCIICSILFYSKFYDSLIEEINVIISTLKISLSKNDLKINKTKNKKRKDEIDNEDVKSNIEMNLSRNIKRKVEKEINVDSKSNGETNLSKNKRRNRKEMNDEIKSNVECNLSKNKKRKKRK